MKKSDGLHIMVLSVKLNSFRIWVEFLIGQLILEVTFSIRLGPLRWVPTAHCAGRRGLNLLTAVRPVELTDRIRTESCCIDTPFLRLELTYLGDFFRGSISLNIWNETKAQWDLAKFHAFTNIV